MAVPHGRSTETLAGIGTVRVATWQFDLAFVPAKSAQPTRTPEGYECAPLEPAVATAARERLKSTLLPTTVPYTGKLCFGDEAGNRFDLLDLDGGRAQLAVRLDARRPANFANLTTEIAKLLACSLYSPELDRMVDPSSAAIRFAIAQSRAARFIKDPATFLSEIDDAS